MKRTLQAWLIFAAWVVLLAGLGWFVQRELIVGSDLRLFLPSPTTPEQRLLLDEIGEGPASRVLVVALGGAAPEKLADVSRALVEALHGSKQFRFVTNGEVSLDALPEELLPYRYLISPTLDTQPLDADFLHRELQTRARDLASPAGSFLEPWLPRDPTLELLKVLQRWQPMQEPHRLYDVWFDRAGKRALLIAETQAPAFDPARQRAAIDELNGALHSIDNGAGLQMTVSGAGKFSVMMDERTRNTAQNLGTIATVGMLVLLFVAYRRIGGVVLSALPLASAGLVGLGAVSALFGEVHGITLAFGFTLIGVAQDYPLHLLSHRRPDHPPVETARELWPALATGVASTCIAYFTFLFSGVIGLAQLACFTVAGLAVAGLTTRFVLPLLTDASGPDYGRSPFLQSLWSRIETLPRLRTIAALVAVVAIAVIVFAPSPWWENDLGKLTPVPEDLIAQDQELRGELGAPDLRYLLVVSAPDNERALSRLEALDAELQGLVTHGVITGYEDAARYVPSSATQLRRQQRLPDAQTLRAVLHSAEAGTPFRAGVFEPFIEDVERARQLPWLTPERLRDSPLGSSLEMLLTSRGGMTTTIVTFSGVHDHAALVPLAAHAGSDVTLLDTKDASEALVANQRTRILWTLVAASIL